MKTQPAHYDHNGTEFLFLEDGKRFRYPRVGLIYMEGPEWDDVLRHGCLEHMRDLFFGPAFDDVMGAHLVEVRSDQLPLLNLSIGLECSRACSRIAAGEKCKSLQIKPMPRFIPRRKKALQVAEAC